jgi:hypothetical protein
MRRHITDASEALERAVHALVLPFGGADFELSWHANALLFLGYPGRMGEVCRDPYRRHVGCGTFPSLKRLLLLSCCRFVTFPLGWRNAAVDVGSAVWSEKSSPGFSQFGSNKRELCPPPPFRTTVWPWRQVPRALRPVKQSIKRGRAASRTAPSRRSAQYSGCLTTWATPSSTGILMLSGSRRVLGRLKPGYNR